MSAAVDKASCLKQLQGKTGTQQQEEEEEEGQSKMEIFVTLPPSLRLTSAVWPEKKNNYHI